MKSLLLLLLSFSAFAQTAVQDRNCDLIQGLNNLTQDFGGLCKYEKANQALGPATPNRVVFIGDSITEGWKNGIPGLDPNDTINRGYSGQTTPQMLVRFRADVINLKPQIVHLMAGTNDLAGNTGPTSLEKIKNNIRTMCELAQMHGIRVVIGSVLPAKVFSWRPGMKPAEDIKALNLWLKTYAQNSGFVYVDYHSAMTDAEGGLPFEYAKDGVHPTPLGYALMRNLAEVAIKEANKK
jgi:acyl-CoA thioesterase I